MFGDLHMPMLLLNRISNKFSDRENNENNNARMFCKSNTKAIQIIGISESFICNLYNKNLGYCLFF